MAKYTIEKFPFSQTHYPVKVTNTDTGKHCKFMVTPDGIDLRSPTPGFPGKNEMNDAEVKAELAAMQEVLKSDLKTA